MINRWILQAAFLLWFLPIALSINYKELELKQRKCNSECLEVLRQLHGPLCLNHRMDFKIPMEVKHPGQMEKRNVALIIEEMLQNIFIVFNSNYSSTGWNKTIVESFLDKLYKQIDFLKKILKEMPKNESLTTRDSTIPRLKSYYERMQRYLEDNGHSSCAWMVTQAEVLRNFMFIKRLTRIF
ncbi:interferon beta [Cricetulus griseus]|uniref:Interferon beta n=1 Tax=Cricetulus griseus TaxID=10029 RepID=G3GXU9_CRIGR|nr:interferon beta [Cricetulus griseus]XP_027256314.1 interferon beta [Cricetulus griseus]EGV95888.1 Interferon beta [Cricetulus griseus]